MIYAQFYHMSVAHQWNDFKSVPIEACGDRSVIILDGRHSLADNKQLTAEWCEKRGYIGYAIHKGESFSRSNQIVEYTPILK